MPRLPDELAALACRFAPRDGRTATALPYLTVLRQTAVTPPTWDVRQPALRLVLQGRAEVRAGAEQVLCGAGEFLACGIALPQAVAVVEASVAQPFLALEVAFDAQELWAVVCDARLPLPRDSAPVPAMLVDGACEAQQQLFLKLLRFLDHPLDAAFLGSAVKREILYRLLTADEHGKLRQQSVIDPGQHGIGHAVRWMLRHFKGDIAVGELAGICQVSPAALHRKFKLVTTLAPIQYQKHLRLIHARELLLAGATGAVAVGARVGYASPSQFCREYRRFFGVAPTGERYASRWQ